jgi:putative DNA primase/helicase
VTANIETFTETKGDRHPTDIAKLAGARLVIASEVDEGRRWDEARIKSLTGRDTLSARKMRRDFFDFRPQFTLIIAGNHKPALKSVDEAIRRRFHLVPFRVTISEADRDPDLKEALRAEADGILAWAVAGCLLWQEGGLKPPSAVLDATRDYLEDEDVVGLWLRECCVVSEGVEDLSALLYESHRRWRDVRGEHCPGQKKFSSTLLDRGFRRMRDAAARKIAGLRLNDTERDTVIQALRESRARTAHKEPGNDA